VKLKRKKKRRLKYDYICVLAEIISNMERNEKTIWNADRRTTQLNKYRPTEVQNARKRVYQSSNKNY
jgi:hypothetical protein